MIQNKPIVAHISSTFFARTQTFIYNYLIKFSHTTPICLSLEPVENRQLFPFPQSDLYTLRQKRYLPPWIYSNIIRILTGRRIQLEQILRDRDASLMHAHFGQIGYLVIQSGRKLELPIITTFYGADINSLQKIRCLPHNWRNIIFESGDLFLVEGLYMQQRLIDLGCPTEKIKIQRIAIPVSKIPWHPRKKIADRNPIVLFSGRFIEKKGLIYALEAVDRLKKEGRSLEFRIIGDGPLSAEARRFIENQNMSEYTRMLGFLDYKDHLNEMNNSDIFIQPSVIARNGETEGGAPTTILEAQAMGLPVVSTYHCDIPNVVIPGRSALLVEERNSSALAETLGYLLDHPTAWEEMGCAGREFVQQYHDVDQEVVKLEEIYLSLIHSSNK